MTGTWQGLRKKNSEEAEKLILQYSVGSLLLCIFFHLLDLWALDAVAASLVMV